MLSLDKSKYDISFEPVPIALIDEDNVLEVDNAWNV